MKFIVQLNKILRLLKINVIYMNIRVCFNEIVGSNNEISTVKWNLVTGV